jgi:SAM-dependent methyltransferase
MTKPRVFVTVLGISALAAVVARHVRGRKVPGGLLIRDTRVYDTLSGPVLGSFYRRIAMDIASVAPASARVLEVGCGPGRLAISLARSHGFDVTGVDLDPAMIDRARANDRRAEHRGDRGPSFLVGDVRSLAFPDGSFDLVVSTLSMHHWADPAAALDEIGRVLRLDGRVIVWDLRSGVHPFHAEVPDAIELARRSSSLQPAGMAPWAWPGRLSLTQRTELVQADRARTG